MDRVVFIAEKETFVVRVLEKKVVDAHKDCIFVKNTLSDVKEVLTNSCLVVLYIDDDTRIQEDVLRFLEVRMREDLGGFILIGEQGHINAIRKQIPEHYIYMAFVRPVNNEEFLGAVSEYFEKGDIDDYKKRILIIDDDPQYLSLIRQWLNGMYKISVANSGLQGIKYLGKNKVDLILLDYEMPVTSGPQVLEMLRSDEDTKDIPVIFLTGKSDKDSVMSVVGLRPEGYLLKSIEKEKLIEKLDEFFVKQK
ncbi:MAG: response regulator [Lachnospiraceae bacterium]|nr:response regulator [Lachnospiraceae bacterium]